jgi:hypothetical protein
VPSEFHSPGEGGGFGLHPIPSVIDLPGTAGVSVEVGGIGSGVRGVSRASDYRRMNGSSDLKMRSGAGNGLAAKWTEVGNGEKNGNGNAVAQDKESNGKDGLPGDVKHYDADGALFPCLNDQVYNFADALLSSINQGYCLLWHRSSRYGSSPSSI